MSLAIILLLVMLVASAVALAFALNTMVTLFRFRVPYVATPSWAIEWLCEHAPLPLVRGGVGGGVPSAEAERLVLGGVVYDLGCGDARVLIALKKKFPAIKATGYEAAWFPYLLARWRTRRTAVTIRHQNFYQANLRDADVVFCFLIHSVMLKVEQLLRSQLKPGATVFSYGFAFPTWPPVERIINPKNPSGSKINIYRQLQIRGTRVARLSTAFEATSSDIEGRQKIVLAGTGIFEPGGSPFVPYFISTHSKMPLHPLDPVRGKQDSTASNSGNPHTNQPLINRRACRHCH